MRVSVITPVRDGEAFIAQTLRSVLNQTQVPAEIIVLDDGSEDRSRDIAQRFGPPVRTVRGPFGGASAARAAGVAQAAGDALMFLDADDLLGPTALAELSEVLGSQPGAIACCPWMRYERVDGCWLAAPASCAPRRPRQDDLAAWLTGWYQPPCSVLWSRRAYEASGGWDPEIGVNDDGDLMMRALVAGVPLLRASCGMAYYRRLPDAVSLSGRRFTRPGLESRLKVLAKVADRLAQAGRIAAYRAPLAEAYDDVARDCRETFPDLHERAGEAARLHGGAEWLRSARRRLDGIRPAARGGERAASPSPVAAPSADRVTPSEERPLVSVVVPTFNRASLLARALESVLAQSYGHFEVLVVDDASTDNTAEVVAAFGDRRLRYLRQPRNAGVAMARNRGLAEAKGALIAFLDSDDEWAPEKLARQVALMRRRPDRVGLVYTGVLEYGAGGDRIERIPDQRGDLWREMLHRNVMTSASGVMIRREVAETVGGFDPGLPAIEDYEYWARIARFYEFDCVPEPLAIYHNEGTGEEAARIRRSRDVAANMAARQVFARRFAQDQAREGVRHLFLLESARRELREAGGDARRGARLLAQALRSRPAEPRAYGLLAHAAYSLLPPKPRRALAPALRAVRARLPRRLSFGSGPV
ncbi:MAG TPA: glycosyltransferase [Falsiroseomonas sp.]|jgi:glycosyltransferase involved in cell wall biosynthesis|nr:glycosyltransferase [Falsiroseomonas sp.]